MKRVIALLLVLLICCVLFAGCKKDEAPKGSTMHTLPPKEDTSTELEWMEIISDLALVNSAGESVIYGRDFEQFALSEKDNEIIIKVSEMATGTLCAQSASSDMLLMINGVETSYVKIDPAKFNGEIRFGKDKTLDELYQIAFRMRNTN